ncbi:MAG: FAD-dependent monooxygenase [Rhodospirillales bacterium]|nr:FAD-dependent monooxygenase [Rhodospirillales bacterium]
MRERRSIAVVGAGIAGLAAGVRLARARHHVTLFVPDPGFAPGSLTQRYIAARVMLGWLPVGCATLGGPPRVARYIQYSAPTPFRRPLVLLGDSAHATSPQLGQRANAALLDAMALADALKRCSDIHTALTEHGVTRRAYIRFYQMASRLMTPFFQSDSVTLARLRGRVFNRLKAMPYFHREMIRTLAGLKTGFFRYEDAA